MKRDWETKFIFTVNGALHEVEDDVEGRSQYHQQQALKAIETETLNAMEYFEKLSKDKPQSTVCMYKLVGFSQPMPPTIHWKERDDKK